MNQKADPIRILSGGQRCFHSSTEQTNMPLVKQRARGLGTLRLIGRFGIGVGGLFFDVCFPDCLFRWARCNRLKTRTRNCTWTCEPEDTRVCVCIVTVLHALKQTYPRGSMRWQRGILLDNLTVSAADRFHQHTTLLAKVTLECFGVDGLRK